MWSKIKIPDKNYNIAFFSALLFGLFVHLFGMVNTLHNYDDIAILPFGFGTAIPSGRWFLGVLGGIYHFFFGSYNLPFFNGFFCLVFVALSARCLVQIFDVRSRRISAAMGFLFAVFPATTSILFFKYTAIYYGFALYLSVLAAKLLIHPRSKGSFFLSALFTVLSLGIYQAYLPVTVTILLVHLVGRALDSREEGAKKIWLSGLMYGLNLLLALIAYRLIVDGIINIANYIIENHYDWVEAFSYGTKVEKISLETYQGINQMGQMSIEKFFGALWSSIKTFYLLPFCDYCCLAQNIVLRCLYPLFYLFSTALVLFTLKVKKPRFSAVMTTILLWLVYPIAVNLITVMCPDSDIYTLMVFSFVMVSCTPLLLWDKAPSVSSARVQKGARRTLGIAILLMIFCYSLLTNLNYSVMYYQNRQIENYAAALMTQIRMTDGYDASKQPVLVGKINDPQFKSPWDDVPTYGIHYTAQDIMNKYSGKSWFSNYIGAEVKWDDSTAKKLRKTEAFQTMPCWPAQGSVKVIDNYVVVKFQE